MARYDADGGTEAPCYGQTVDGGFGTLPGSSIELNAGLGSVLLAIQHPIFRGVKVKTVATTNTADLARKE